MQEINILKIFQVSYLIVDEADREMEIVSDPFLDAGIDIPKELPYHIMPNRPKSLKQRLCPKLSRSHKDSSDVEDPINIPFRADKTGDNVYVESRPAMMTNESYSKPLSSDEQGITRVSNSVETYHFDTIRHWDEFQKSLAEI